MTSKEIYRKKETKTIRSKTTLFKEEKKMSYKDPKKKKQYYKAWIRRNLKKVKEDAKVYYLKNRDRILEQTKTYKEVNKCKWKKYREINKEKINIKHKAWQKANPEKNREYARNHRALKRTTQVEPISEKLVYLRDGWICQHCKKRVNKSLKWPDPKSPSLDHIIPLNKDGTHTYNNVHLTHLNCNLTKYINILPQGEQLRLF